MTIWLSATPSGWGRCIGFLGLSVGVIVHGLSQDQRLRAYGSDITYGTNNEFGFDYLRDNLVYDPAEMVQRGHNFAIVDEVDSILIDEARTPLIISGPTEDRSEFYRTMDQLVRRTLIQDPRDLSNTTRSRSRSTSPSTAPTKVVEEMLLAGGHLEPDSAPASTTPANISVVHHVNQALRANVLYTRDKDYIVKAGEVILIDEFTGRMMHGPAPVGGAAPGHRGQGRRRGPAREPDAGLGDDPELLPPVQEAVRHDRHRRHRGPGVRRHLQDGRVGDPHQPARHSASTTTTRSTAPPPRRTRAILKQIEDCYLRGQPILVGTVSIEKSGDPVRTAQPYSFEHEGAKTVGIPHQRAQRPLSTSRRPTSSPTPACPARVTIATNMAGRGTDIQLGGNSTCAWSAGARSSAAWDRPRRPPTSDLLADEARS